MTGRLSGYQLQIRRDTSQEEIREKSRPRRERCDKANNKAPEKNHFFWKRDGTTE